MFGIIGCSGDRQMNFYGTLGSFVSIFSVISGIYFDSRYLDVSAISGGLGFQPIHH